MAHACNCTLAGKGSCCMGAGPTPWNPAGTAPQPAPLTTWTFPQPIDWDRLREIIREEIRAAKS